MFILCPNRYYFPSHIFSFPNCAPQGIQLLKQASSFSLVRNIVRKHWQQWRQLSNSLHPSGPNKTEIWQYLVAGKTWVRHSSGLRGLKLRVIFFLFFLEGGLRLQQLHSWIAQTFPRNSLLCGAEAASPVWQGAWAPACSARGASALIHLEGKSCFHQIFS